MDPHHQDILTAVIMVPMIIFFWIMYIKNLIKLVRALKLEDYGIHTIARVAGVFIIPVGFVMGFV